MGSGNAPDYPTPSWDSGAPGPTPFPRAAPGALADQQLRSNLRFATGAIRKKRAGVVSEVPGWDELRAEARSIKARVLADLDDYLDELEASAVRAGGTVHRAGDSLEANAIVGGLVEKTGASSVVKVKSITTDEIGLNQSLASRGIRAIETDLAELIIQLAGETSSHFLVPAIHKNRKQIRDLFRDRLHRPDLTDDPQDLAEAARLHLREQFLSAEVAVSGANFAVAETGTVGVVESEGNGRMCLTLPRTLITVMGVEKVLPSLADIGVFLQLLPRSATGERMNPYTTLWTGIQPGDGPEAFHLVLLDNGRRRVLADPIGRQALHCIRCSACLNICPVYARVGGHAYNATYPGPIGSILTPQLLGPGGHDSLPFASTLCGACRDACPVDIDIPSVLLHLRRRAVEGEASKAPLQERLSMAFLGWLFRSPARYQKALSIGRNLPFPGRGEGWIPRLPGYASGWTMGRDLPDLAEESFREWWIRRARTRTESPVRGLATGRGSGEAGRYQDAPAAAHGGGGGAREEMVLQFVHRLEDYGATVIRCSPSDLPGTVAKRLSERGEGEIALPEALPEAWTREVSDGARRLLRDVDSGLSKAQLDAASGVVSGCSLGIAETGTLVLEAGGPRGRRALTLLPDYHLCIVREEQIVASVPDAIPALEAMVREGAAALTLVSGPSATSDIELVRVEGVHGPRTVDVILVDSDEGPQP